MSREGGRRAGLSVGVLVAVCLRVCLPAVQGEVASPHDDGLHFHLDCRPQGHLRGEVSRLSSNGGKLPWTLDTFSSRSLLSIRTPRSCLTGIASVPKADILSPCVTWSLTKGGEP